MCRAGRPSAPLATVRGGQDDGASGGGPSHGSALFTAAIHGVRGTMRTARHLMPLTDASARAHCLGLDEALRHNAVARRLLERGPRAPHEAADLAERLTGIHEIAGNGLGRTPRHQPAPAVHP
ncbi:hypothetical protein [Streptomyces lavendofoliae]|uniref:hypothetical protein n=1 Tax=Streptomyces lavendofoliae TaxID=67314 RepID=UPI00300F3A09